MDDWFVKLLIAIGSIITALGGKSLWGYLANRPKTEAEAKQITASSDLSILQQSEQMSKEYRELFKQAEMEVRLSRRHWMNAEFLIREMLYALERANVPGWQEFEKQFHDLQKETNSDEK